ncbi:MAG TPA: BrnT family toxin [Solirubrobacterales bacterium]|nr:BrnT family toxin [Solirubrobacterales bacterium]
MRFEWDPPKAEANLRVHGVGFSEAVTVLEDDFALTREDSRAVDEPRFVTLGLSSVGNLLVVVYGYHEPDVIRVISAWKANRRQRRLYEKGRS